MSSDQDTVRKVRYERVDNLDVEVVTSILERSGLSERRPVHDRDRLRRMLANSNLMVLATEESTGKPIAIARALTDFAYACYLSDLAVDKEWQGLGVGTRLIE